MTLSCAARLWLAALLLPAVLHAGEEAASDWPCWRGPEGNGISPETGFPKKWPREGLERLWTVELGAGFSSFAAVGEFLYTLRQKGEVQEAVCMAAASGDIVWSHVLEPAYKERQGGDGPRATPCVKDGIVYALGARGTLAALSTTDGKPLWKLNVLKKLKAENLDWGLSASPIVEGDKVVIPVGAPGSPVAAFHRKTGQVLWTSGSDGQGDVAGYSTPLAVRHGDEKQLLVFLGKSLVALEPERGRVLWSYFWKTDWNVNAAAPVYHDGLVFISSGYGHGSVLLEAPTRRGRFPVEVWKSRVMCNKFKSCVLFEDHLYGFDETFLKCVEFRTGKEKWAKRGFGYGSVLIADGHLILLSDRGNLALARADSTAYRQVAHMDRVLTGRCWTVPVLHRGVLYLRSLKHAVALDMRPR